MWIDNSLGEIVSQSGVACSESLMGLVNRGALPRPSEYLRACYPLREMPTVA